MSLFWIIIIIILIILCIYLLTKKTKPLNLMSSVDLSKYSGLWYEIARLPVPFEDFGSFKCLNATAYYNINPDNSINVINSCNTSRGKIQAVGKAIPKNIHGTIANPGTLSIKFQNSPFTGEYNIIYVDPNYHYALVGSRNRKNLWILSRTRNIDSNSLNLLLQIAFDNDFSIDKLIFDNYNNSKFLE